MLARLPHQGSADPHLLRRRDLPRGRHALREGRDAGHRLQPAAPALHPLRPQVRRGRRRQPPLRPEARLPLVAHHGPRRGAGRRTRARHRLRSGRLRRELAKKGCIVDGADQFPPAEPSVFRRFVPWTEPDPLPVASHDYDDVLLLDIIEHLRDPEGLLEGYDAPRRAASRRLARSSRPAMSGFAVVRLQLLFGNFNYGKRGILDLTHTRLFTFSSLRRLFEQARVRRRAARGPAGAISAGPRHERGVPRPHQAQHAADPLPPRLFSYQIL